MSTTKHYRVWTLGKRPEDGVIIAAVSSFEARQVCARAWGKDITDVMARRKACNGGQSRKTFRVVWEIDVDASSPQEAAAVAFRLVQKPDTTATVFDVKSPDGVIVTVDLLETSNG